MGRQYLRDDQWAKIKDLLPGRRETVGVTAKDNRLFVEAILWIARTGAMWRELPERFGKWNSVFQRYNRWSKAGVFERLFQELADDPDF
jgi:transposase